MIKRISEHRVVKMTTTRDGRFLNQNQTKVSGILKGLVVHCWLPCLRFRASQLGQLRFRSSESWAAGTPLDEVSRGPLAMDQLLDRCIAPRPCRYEIQVFETSRGETLMMPASETAQSVDQSRSPSGYVTSTFFALRPSDD